MMPGGGAQCSDLDVSGAVLDDTAPAAWLEVRLSGESGAVARTLPDGYLAYGRDLRPAGGFTQFSPSASRPLLPRRLSATRLR